MIARALIAALLLLMPLAAALEPVAAPKAESFASLSARVENMDANVNVLAQRMVAFDNRDKATRLVQGAEFLLLGLGVGLAAGAACGYALRDKKRGGGV